MLSATFDLNSLIGIAVDVIVIALVLIFAIVGAKKGLVKMLYGLISAVVVIALSVVLVSPVTNLIIKNTSLDDKLMTALEEPIAKNLPESYATLYYYDTDGNAETADELVCDKDGTIMPYDHLFEGTIYETLGLHKLIKPMVETALENQEFVYLVDAVTFALSSIIILVGVFIALMIVLRILMAIIIAILKKLIASLYVVHFIDKLCGFVLGLALGAVFVLLILTVMQLLQTFSFMEPVFALFERSYVTKFVLENNFLYTWLASVADIPTLLAKWFPSSVS